MTEQQEMSLILSENPRLQGSSSKQIGALESRVELSDKVVDAFHFVVLTH